MFIRSVPWPKFCSRPMLFLCQWWMFRWHQLLQSSDMWTGKKEEKSPFGAQVIMYTVFVNTFLKVQNQAFRGSIQ